MVKRMGLPSHPHKKETDPPFHDFQPTLQINNKINNPFSVIQQKKDASEDKLRLNYFFIKIRKIFFFFYFVHKQLIFLVIVAFLNQTDCLIF